MRVMALVLAAALMAGCFEWRYEWGLDDAHYQVSPWWRDSGLYQSLPDAGRVGDFTVQRGGLSVPDDVHAPAPDSASGPSGPSGPPPALPFDTSGVEAAWGEQVGLRFIRWMEYGDDGSTRLWLQLDPESVMVWVPGGDPRPVVVEFLTAVTALDADGRAAFADEVFAGARARSLPFGPAGSHVAGMHYGAPFAGPYADAGLLDELGGVNAFTPQPRGQPTALLPHFGQVVLVQDRWEIFLETPAKRLDRGDFADAEVIWVTPDDSTAYVHWGARELSDRAVTKALLEAMRDLGRTPPDASGFSYVREDVSGGPGD